MTLSVATTPDPRGRGSDSNEGILRILQCCSITAISPSDCFVSYYPSAEMLLVYSIAPADLDTRGGVLPHCTEGVVVFYSLGRLGHSLRGGVLPYSRETVGVFYRPSQLGHLWGVLPHCTEGVVFYNLGRLDHSLGVGSLTLLQRCSRCIL